MLFYHHLNSTFCLGVFSLFFIFHTIFYLSFFINIQIFVLLGRDGIPSASFCKKRYGLYIILSKQLHMIFLNNCSVNFRIKFLCNHCTILSLGKRKLVSSPTLHFFLSLAIFYKLQYKSSIPLLYTVFCAKSNREICICSSGSPQFYMQFYCMFCLCADMFHGDLIVVCLIIRGGNYWCWWASYWNIMPENVYNDNSDPH